MIKIQSSIELADSFSLLPTIMQDTQKENHSIGIGAQDQLRKSMGYQYKLARALQKILKIYRGVSKGTHALIPKYHCEVFDRKHRYGRELNPFFEVWKESSSTDDFDKWLNDLDIGKNVVGRDILQKLNLIGSNNRPKFIPRVGYLKKSQLKNYEMRVDRQGRIFIGHPENACYPHSVDRSKDHSYIFIATSEDRMYIGPYQRGIFSHSSFLCGGSVKSAGALIFDHGKLMAVWDDSGHYNSGHYKAGAYDIIYKIMRSALEIFIKRGVSLKDVEVIVTNKKEKHSTSIKALNFLNTPLLHIGYRISISIIFQSVQQIFSSNPTRQITAIVPADNLNFCWTIIRVFRSMDEEENKQIQHSNDILCIVPTNFDY